MDSQAVWPLNQRISTAKNTALLSRKQGALGNFGIHAYESGGPRRSTGITVAKKSVVRANRGLRALASPVTLPVWV